jgi:hypothetical protein
MIYLKPAAGTTAAAAAAAGEAASYNAAQYD